MLFIRRLADRVGTFRSEFHNQPLAVFQCAREPTKFDRNGVNSASMPSASKDLEHPQTLVSLPQPVNRSKGRTRAAVVWSGSSRRKRPEVVIAVDGEGINIYNV